MKEKKYCLVQFKYICNLDKDEKPKVVGSCNQLGNWDITKAEPMTFSNFGSPVWKTKENIKLEQNSLIEYKFIIFKNGKLVRWENLPNNGNRRISIGNNIRIVLSDIQDNPMTTIERSDCIETENEYKALGFKEECEQEIYDISDDNFSYELEEVLDNKEKDEEQDEGKFEDLNYESGNESEQFFQRKKPLESQSEISDKDDIIMCSVYLPYNVIRDKENKLILELTNEPIYHSLLRIIENKKNIKWFGSIKNYSSLSDSEKSSLTIQLKSKNMFLFELDNDTFNTNNIFFKEILEPLFHYITINLSISEEYAKFDYYWESYKKMNEQVCNSIIPHLKPHSLIYLHDYYFFLVPNYLYSKCVHLNQNVFQNLSVGLFLHSPFPSHEVFKRIPFREEILKSLMNCSVIGFHTFDYSRNFLKSAKQLLSINYESTINGDLAVNYYERAVIIRVKNATPEIGLIENDFKSEEFNKYYTDIKEKYKNKCVYASLDHMNFLPCIKTKLEGYLQFLGDFKGDIKQNVFLEYIRYSHEDLDQNGNLVLDSSQKKMLKEIQDMGKLIKEKYGDETIQIIIKNVSYCERLAIFACANCFIRSSKLESFSLGIYEFLILKRFLNESEISYMISELSGVNTSIAGTIKINPFDYKSIHAGFFKAFQTYADKEKNNATKEKDFQHVMKSSLKEWYYSFLKDIKNAKLTDENTYYIGVGAGLNFKLMKINSGFKKLNIKELIPQYEKSKRRILFFDNEGTLPSINSDNSLLRKSKSLIPSNEILSYLGELAHDRRNTIFIVTGYQAKKAQELFGGVKDIWIVAEHGFVYKYNSGNKRDEWKKTIKEFNNNWIDKCVEIIEPYTERCDGSFIDKKEASVAWYYMDCDKELGKAFAAIITSELEFAVSKMGLKVINEKGLVEVIPYGINKGWFVSYVIKETLRKGHVPDFVFCIGDDIRDEKMFQYLKCKGKSIRKYMRDAKVNSVIVGKKPSDANYYVDTTNEVGEIIKQFVKASRKLSLSLSTVNMRKKSKDGNDLFDLNENDIIKEENDS